MSYFSLYFNPIGRNLLISSYLALPLSCIGCDPLRCYLIGIFCFVLYLGVFFVCFFLVFATGGILRVTCDIWLTFSCVSRLFEGTVGGSRTTSIMLGLCTPKSLHIESAVTTVMAFGTI